MTDEKQADREPQVPSMAKKKPNLLWLWILITAIVVGGGVSAFAYRGVIKEKFWPSKKSTETSTTATTAPVATGVKIVDEGITWLTPREKLGDLGLFKKAAGSESEGPDFGYLSTDYYKVAMTSDGGEIILATAKIQGLGVWDDFHHFLKKGGVYYWLSENSDAVGGDAGKANYYARTNSDTNSTLVIKSLQLDKTITKGTTRLTQDSSSSRYDTFASGTEVGTKIEETKWGDIYLLKGKEIDKSNGDAKVAQYYILRNDGQKIIYHPEATYRNDDGTFDVTWSKTAGNGQKFSQIKTAGCGGAGGSFPLVLDNDSIKSKVEAGSTSGAKIYTVALDSTLAEFAYQVYMMDGMTGKVTKDVMMANLGLIILQDGYGNWAGYLNDAYAPAVECGKPVIYLYPTKNTEVSVKVGANITKSEPLYNSGWKVLATPVGNLTLAGKSYDSLFWEGTGWGSYPEITSGTVVAKSEIAATITSQLSTMGLNAKEINDFKDFWLPKMPATPYTRLSWLTTDQMNILAPLAVSPKPDTSIRVFLDFEGLQSKVSMTQQILPKYQRSGFTLVEWGGLLRGSN